jgi:hypothetical protein
VVVVVYRPNVIGPQTKPTLCWKTFGRRRRNRKCGFGFQQFWRKEENHLFGIVRGFGSKEIGFGLGL